MAWSVASLPENPEPAICLTLAIGNLVILLGACAGAGTVSDALRALQDEAGSKLPVLGFTVPYALGSILPTAWRPVIVLIAQ